MSTFDSEDLLDSIESILTGNLNTKIAAIEAEKTAKGKGLARGLSSIASAAYFRQTWDEKLLNRTPAIFYGIEEVSPVDGGTNTGERYKIFVEVVLCDGGQDNDSSRRIARYTRALKEVFQDYFKSVSEMGRIKIETVRPISFKLELDSSEEIKVGGVSLNITLA